MRTHHICFLDNSHLSKTGCSLSLPLFSSKEAAGAANLVDFQLIGIYDEVMSVLV